MIGTNLGRIWDESGTNLGRIWDEKRDLGNNRSE
jgi:hypothetical protein